MAANRCVSDVNRPIERKKTPAVHWELCTWSMKILIPSFSQYAFQLNNYVLVILVFYNVLFLSTVKCYLHRNCTSTCETLHSISVISELSTSLPSLIKASSNTRRLQVPRCYHHIWDDPGRLSWTQRHWVALCDYRWGSSSQEQKLQAARGLQAHEPGS